MEYCHLCTCRHMPGKPNKTCDDQLPFWLWALCVSTIERAIGQVMRDVGFALRHPWRFSEFLANPWKLEQFAVFDLACGTDRQTVVMTGQVWSRFDRDVGHDADHVDRSRASILLGRGSKQFVLCWFLALPPAPLRLDLLLRHTQGADELVNSAPRAGNLQWSAWKRSSPTWSVIRFRAKQPTKGSGILVTTLSNGTTARLP